MTYSVIASKTYSLLYHMYIPNSHALLQFIITKVVKLKIDESINYIPFYSITMYSAMNEYDK